MVKIDVEIRNLYCFINLVIANVFILVSIYYLGYENQAKIIGYVIQCGRSQMTLISHIYTYKLYDKWGIKSVIAL